MWYESRTFIASNDPRLPISSTTQPSEMTPQASARQQRKSVVTASRASTRTEPDRHVKTRRIRLSGGAGRAYILFFGIKTAGERCGILIRETKLAIGGQGAGRGRERG